MLKLTVTLLALVCCAVHVFAATCTDGKDNVLQIGDVNDATLKIHFSNVKVQSYTGAGVPACHAAGEPLVLFPGIIKILDGQIKVDVKNDLTNTGVARLTLASAGILGKICDNGKSKNGLIPDSDCTLHVCDLLGASLCNLLETPGTYNLGQLEGADQGFNGTVGLPSLGAIGSILTGRWQLQLELDDQANASELLLKIALPPTGYIYLGNGN